jgi:hypothetical protein
MMMIAAWAGRASGVGIGARIVPSEMENQTLRPHSRFDRCGRFARSRRRVVCRRQLWPQQRAEAECCPQRCPALSPRCGPWRPNGSGSQHTPWAPGFPFRGWSRTAHRPGTVGRTSDQGRSSGRASARSPATGGSTAPGIASGQAQGCARAFFRSPQYPEALDATQPLPEPGNGRARLRSLMTEHRVSGIGPNVRSWCELDTPGWRE